MMRAAAASVASLTLAVLAVSPVTATEQVQTQAIDRVVRYIDDRFITFYDLRVLYTEWRHQQLAIGGEIPTTIPGQVAKLEELKDLLTEQILLEQHADQLGVVVDERPLRRHIRDRAHATGQPQMLSAAVDLLEREVRQERIDAVLNFYQRPAVHVSPVELERAYQKRREEFRRPVRRHLLRIVRRPTSEAELQQVTQDLLEVFRSAQVDPAAAVQAVVTPEIRAAYVEARERPADQRALLVDVARAVVAAVPEDPEPKTRHLHEQATAALARAEAVTDVTDVQAQLAAVRERLLALAPDQRAERFAEIARSTSQGPRAAQGGDLGWAEPGALGEPYDERAAALTTVGAVSETFAVGNSFAILLLVEREESQVRTLAEVSAELRNRLQYEQRKRIRDRLVAALREEAMIQDLDPLTAEDLRATPAEVFEAHLSTGELFDDLPLQGDIEAAPLAPQR